MKEEFSPQRRLTVARVSAPRRPLNLSTFTALELRDNRWETCGGCKKCAASGGNNDSPSGSPGPSIRRAPSRPSRCFFGFDDLVRLSEGFETYSDLIYKLHIKSDSSVPGKVTVECVPLIRWKRRAFHSPTRRDDGRCLLARMPCPINPKM